MKINALKFPGIILFLFLGTSCTVLKPTAPADAGIDIPKIVQPVSNVEVPVTVDLKSYITQAENSVPSRYSDNQQPCEGLRYNYVFTRTPFTITGSNDVIDLNFIGSYGFNVSYCAKCTTLFGASQCIVPVISAQCGMGNEPPRRIQISYQSTINVMPDYHLHSKTILYPAPNPIDRCNVLMGNIDVTNKLIQYVSGPLNDLGKLVDAKIATYNIKPMVEKLWNGISTETKLGDAGYININPLAVRVSNFSLNGSLLNFSVGISAKPVITINSNPTPAKLLPDLSAYAPANGFNIYLDLLENYDHLTQIVNQQIDGQQTAIAGKQFVVNTAKVFGIGTKIVMQIDFSGSETGTIYLVATPTYDPATHELSFPDLSFDLQTKAWMLKAAKWMFNGQITEMIRRKATYNLSKFISDSKNRIQNQLSRDLGNGITSQVNIQNLDIQAIYPTSEKLIIRTLSTGQVKVKVVMPAAN
jgi:hypothetical protein